MSSHLQQCHLGIFKLSTLLKKFVWHHSLMKVVRDVCRTCSVCQTCKVSSQLVVPPMLRITTSGPFELVAVDLISLPTTSTGYIGCLMMVDHFSKWVVGIPIRNKKSHTICQALERNILPNIPRIPVRILTDNGPEFISEEFKLILERYNITHVCSTLYKASSNGAIEWVNRTIGELLRVLNQYPRKWDESLTRALLSYNHSVHSEIGCTPAESILKNPHDINSLPLLSAGTRSPWADGHPRYQPFRVGTLVLRKIKLLGNLTVNKLVPRFDGPYRVDRVNPNQVTYEITHIDTNVSVKAHHIQLKPWCEPPSYLKKHVQFYELPSQGSLNDVPVVNPMPVVTPMPAVTPSLVPGSDGTVEDTDSSSDNGCRLPIPVQFVKRFLCKKVPPVPKSILKPPGTYERKAREKALTLFSQNDSFLDCAPVLTPTPQLVLSIFDQNDSLLDSTPVLTPTPQRGLSILDQHDSLLDSTPVLDPTPQWVPDVRPSLLDWDVSPITLDNSFATARHLSFEGTDSRDSDLALDILFGCESVGSLDTSVDLDLGLAGLFDNSDISSADFSGFPDLDKNPPKSPPGRVTSVVRTYRAVREAVKVMNRESSSPSSSLIGGRLSLSPVYKEIYEARELINKHRKRARDRAHGIKRKLEYGSPPFTRSKGKAIPLPNVQTSVLERRGK